MLTLRAPLPQEPIKSALAEVPRDMVSDGKTKEGNERDRAVCGGRGRN